MVFAAVSVVLILVASYSVTAGSADEIHARRTASDIVAVLDYTGVLGTFNSTQIESNLTALAPSNLKLGMNISRYSAAGNFNGSMEISYGMNGSYYSGRWWYAGFAGKTADKFYLVQYKVAFR